MDDVVRRQKRERERCMVVGVGGVECGLG